MSFIYSIENIITGEKYIGNTSFDIKKRWREHCHDANRHRCKNRPLYAAINKYGKDNFKVSIIEKCDDNISFDREKYWIEKYGTFKNGYNCTLGGKGALSINYDELIDVYKSTRNMKQTAIMLGISVDSVSNILDAAEVEKATHKELQRSNSKAVIAESMLDNSIMSFSSLHDASKWILSLRPYLKSRSSIRQNIVNACVKKYRYAYGFEWRFADKV